MKRKRKLVLAQQMGFSPFASVKQGQGLLGQFSTADEEQAVYNQNLFNQGFRPVSLYGTHPSGASSTTVARPVVSQDYASNQRTREQQQQRVNERNRIVLKKRAEMRDNKGDFSTGNFTTQEKFRFFPSSVGGVGQAIDEYLNPAYFVGSLASNLGNSFSQSRDQGSVMPTLGALGSTVLAGVAGFDPLGGAIKGYKGYASPAMDATTFALGNQYNTLRPLYKEAYSTFKNTSDLPFGKRLENALYSGATSTKLPGDVGSHSYFKMLPDEVKEAMSNEIKKLPEGSFTTDYNMSHNSAPLMYTQALKNSNKGFRVIRTGETRPLNDAAMMGDRFDKALPQSVREAIAPEMTDYRSRLSDAESRYKTAQELHSKGSISDMDLVDEKELYRDAMFDLHPYNRVLGTLTPDQKLEFIQNYKSTLDNPLASINKATGINLPMSSVEKTSIPRFSSRGNLVGETPSVEHRVPIMRVLKEGSQPGLRLKQMKPSLKGMLKDFKNTYDMWRNPNPGFPATPAPAVPNIPEYLYIDPSNLIIDRSPNYSDILNTTRSNQTSTQPFQHINYENLPPRPPGGWEQVQIYRSGGRVKQNAGKPVPAQQIGYTGLGFDPDASKAYHKIQLGQPPTSETQYGIPSRSNALIQQQIQQQKQQTALQHQPVIKTAPSWSPGHEQERTAKNQTHASNWGMRFDPVTGNVKPVFSDQFTDFSNRAGDFALDAVNAGFLGEGVGALGDIGKLAPEAYTNLYRIQQKGAQTFADLAAEGKIPKVFNRPEVLARKANEEKHFGQWFTNSKNDLNWYMRDREFTNPEVLHTRVPTKDLPLYQGFDKSLSRAPDREFILPQGIVKQAKKYRSIKDLPNQQYGGNMKQNAGGGDAYDFGSSVLQNYTQMQAERQNTEQQQYAQEPQGEPAPEDTSAETEVQGDPDELGIPDADYFARKSYEYNGDREMQDKIDEISAQMTELQNNYNLLLAGQTDDFPADNEEDEDGEGGDGYYSGASSTAGTTPAGPVTSTSDAPAAIPKGGGSAAMRYNNPGNIKYSPFSAGFGATKGGAATDGGNFAYFPTVKAGLDAQKALLKGPGYRDLTVTAAMKRWSNNGPYSSKIGKAFGNKLMKDLSDEEMNELVKMQIQGEDAAMYRSLYKQHGGDVPIADYPAAKRHGLNNEQLNELLIKNSGYNHYRGLDSGKPVHLYDDLGASTVLFGPDDLATLYGNVYEHR